MYNLSMRLRFFLGLSFLLLAGCASQLSEQDGGDLTRTEVEYLNRKMIAAVETEYPLVQHKALNRYISALGQSIVARNPSMPPLPYEFRLLKTYDLLSFSLPGGVIYLSLGLMNKFEVEGHLVAALAHELAHQQLNHPLLHWRKKVNANRGRTSLLNFEDDWQMAFMGKDGAVVYSEGFEKEADQMAPVIMYRGRFDPRLYVSFLQELKLMEVKKSSSISLWMNAHPLLSERLKWSKEALTKIPPRKEGSISSPAFRQIRAILKMAEAKGREKKGLE